MIFPLLTQLSFDGTLCGSLSVYIAYIDMSGDFGYLLFNDAGWAVSITLSPFMSK